MRFANVSCKMIAHKERDSVQQQWLWKVHKIDNLKCLKQIKQGKDRYEPWLQALLPCSGTCAEEEHHSGQHSVCRATHIMVKRK